MPSRSQPRGQPPERGGGGGGGSGFGDGAGWYEGAVVALEDGAGFVDGRALPRPDVPAWAGE